MYVVVAEYMIGIVARPSVCQTAHSLEGAVCLPRLGRYQTLDWHDFRAILFVVGWPETRF